jgi:5'-deoxynucleotidase YfbR-like HD superfamily hydrolase
MLKPDAIRRRHMREAAAAALEMAAGRARSDLDDNPILRMALTHCLEILAEDLPPLLPALDSALPEIEK